MKYINHIYQCCFVLLLLFSSICFANDNDRIDVNLFISKIKFNEQSNLNSEVGYGFGISYQFNKYWNTGMFFQTGDSKLIFDNIGDLGEQYIHTHMLLLKVGYMALTLPLNLNIHLNAGVGIIIFKTREQQIFLGGLGEVNIPEKKDTDNLFVLGAGISKPLSSKLNLMLLPEIFFFNSSNQFSTNFNLSGGISFALY